jgi:hypothetical protein
MFLHTVRRNRTDVRDAGGVTKVIVLVAMVGDILIGILLHAHRFTERVMMMGHDGHDQHPHAGQQQECCYVPMPFHQGANISISKGIAKAFSLFYQKTAGSPSRAIPAGHL